MKVKKYLRGNKVVAGIEVTKGELLDLINEYDFVSVSKADLNWLETVKNNEVVGVILGDIEAFNNPKYINPDCWFVNKTYMDKHYKDLENSFFTFGEAITLLKQGYKVARKGWNGKGMFIFLFNFEENISPTGQAELMQALNKILHPDINRIKHYQIDPCLVMKTANDTLQPGWLASQADILAEDWVLVKDN